MFVLPARFEAELREGVIKATTSVPSDLLNVFLITVRMLARARKLLIEIHLATEREPAGNLTLLTN